MKVQSQFVIIDSGFLIALHTSKDKFHAKAVHVCQEMRNRKWISTWPVITETCHFFIQKNNIQATTLLFDMLGNNLMELFHLENKYFSKIKTLMIKYKDLPMDLADASLVILAEAIGTGDILSTDQRDFKTYRWKSRHPFHNFLEEDL